MLIANNGMAATKSILSMRQWAYMELGDDRAIEFIAMATPEDLNANAEFIRLADRFVEVRRSHNSDTRQPRAFSAALSTLLRNIHSSRVL